MRALQQNNEAKVGRHFYLVYVLLFKLIFSIQPYNTFVFINFKKFHFEPVLTIEIHYDNVRILERN